MKENGNNGIKASTRELHDAADDVKAQAQDEAKVQEAQVSDRDSIVNSGFFKKIMASAVAIASRQNRVLQLLQRAYAKLSKERGREQLAHDVMRKFNLFLRLAKSYYNGEYRNVPWSVIVKIVAGILYFVTIIDLIPDFIPVIGYTDDIAVLLWIYTSIEGELVKFEDWEHSHSEVTKS